MAGDALPLSIGRLRPRIGEAFVKVERFTGCIGALGSEVPDGNGGVAENHDLQINVVDTGILGRLGLRDRLLVTSPSEEVSVRPSARSDSSGAVLLVCWDFSHCCSRSEIVFSVPAFFCANDHVAIRISVKEGSWRLLQVLVCRRQEGTRPVTRLSATMAANHETGGIPTRTAGARLP